MNQEQAVVRIRYLDLDATNVDADSVGALVGVVREFQGGRSLQSIATQLEPPPGDEERQAPPLALPPKQRRPRALKAAPATSAKVTKGSDGRGLGSGATVLAAMATGAQLNRNKLAQQIYGDTSNPSLTKLNHAIAYQVRTGKAKKNADGTFTVL